MVGRLGVVVPGAVGQRLVGPALAHAGRLLVAAGGVLGGARLQAAEEDEGEDEHGPIAAGLHPHIPTLVHVTARASRHTRPPPASAGTWLFVARVQVPGSASTRS